MLNDIVIRFDIVIIFDKLLGINISCSWWKNKILFIIIEIY